MRNFTVVAALSLVLALSASAAYAQTGDTATNIALSDLGNKASGNSAGTARVGDSTLADYRTADELLGQAIQEDQETRKAKLLQKAMKRAERVTREAEEWPDAWRLMGRIAFRIEDWETCRSGFERAAELYTEESQISDAQINARYCESRAAKMGAP